MALYFVCVCVCVCVCARTHTDTSKDVNMHISQSEPPDQFTLNLKWKLCYCRPLLYFFISYNQ